MTVPASVADRLWAFDPRELDPGDDVVIAAVLELGERPEIAWLRTELDDRDLAEWVRVRSGRRLSRRSRAFWCAYFGITAPPRPAPIARDLWPLA